MVVALFPIMHTLLNQALGRKLRTGWKEHHVGLKVECVLSDDCAEIKGLSPARDPGEEWAYLCFWYQLSH